MQVIAYTYEADHHCEACAGKRFGIDENGVIAGVDSEGNDVGVVFDTDEWFANDVYEGNDTATLACGTCGEVIEESDLTR